MSTSIRDTWLAHLSVVLVLNIHRSILLMVVGFDHLDLVCGRSDSEELTCNDAVDFTAHCMLP